MIACHYLVWTLFEAEIVLIDFGGFLGFKASTILRVSRIDAQYRESTYVFVPFFIYFEMFLKLYSTLDEFIFYAKIFASLTFKVHGKILSSFNSNILFE